MSSLSDEQLEVQLEILNAINRHVWSKELEEKYQIHKATVPDKVYIQLIEDQLRDVARFFPTMDKFREAQAIKTKDYEKRTKA